MDGVWITVENKRNSGDFVLGISKVLVQGFRSLPSFPQSSPQLFIARAAVNLFLIREEFCNYKKVIINTHKFTAVITTNFKYKTFLWRVPSTFKPLVKSKQLVRIAAI